MNVQNYPRFVFIFKWCDQEFAREITEFLIRESISRDEQQLSLKDYVSDYVTLSMKRSTDMRFIQ